jgi:small ligand-binding sensory domain FIST
MSVDLFLRTAQASGDHWGTTVKAALTALGPLPGDVNFGLVCVTVPLTEHLPSIMTFLRETTPIRGWAIAVGAGLTGPVGTVRDRPAIALLVARLPANAFRLIDSWKEPRRKQFLAQNKAWLAGQDMPVGLMQGDAFDPDLPDMIADLAGSAHSFLVGGVAPGQPGGLSGVLLGEPLTLVTGLTQGCQTLPGRFQITEVTDEIIMKLDGKPALDALKSAAGENIAEDLHQAAGVIHLGLPVAGSDRGDYLVRSLLGIDPERGWLAVGSRLSEGDHIIFVQRDNDSAARDMRRMLADIAGRIAGRSILGGIYVSCVARGAAMFGTDHAEMDMITQGLGPISLIGIISQGEFCHDRLYGYTGVLALILS